MRYFAFNGPSPHAFMWRNSGGNLQYAGRNICFTELIGIEFEQSVIDTPARNKILMKYPELNIPVMRTETKTVDDVEVEEKVKTVYDVQIGDHIICFYTAQGKYISNNMEENDGIVIDDFEVVAPSM